MDADRFDTLTRALTAAGSRRRALSSLLTGALGILGWQNREETRAHDLSKRCKKKSGNAKKKCLKKAKKHRAQHASEGSSPTSTVSASCADGVHNGGETDTDCGGPCPPCADGQGCAGQGDCQSRVCTNNVCQAPACDDRVKNGSETGVDCGGSCPRCPTGQGCTTRNDCATAFCSGGTCQSCSVGADCPNDQGGACTCQATGICSKANGAAAPDCESCPADTATCFPFAGEVACLKHCGVA